MSNRFGYVITIYNQEDILERTFEGVLRVAGKDAVIVPVVDGCTDGSEAIVDSWKRQANREVRKVKTPNVHEILSINAGIQASPDVDYHVILQGDVVLKERLWEEKTVHVYSGAPRLGYLSYRLGANLRRGTFRELALVHEDLIECSFGHGLSVELAPAERLSYRMAAIKSPVCLPRFLREALGIMDQALAPYSWDDHEYSLRCLRAGYYSGVFPLEFESRLEWGGTRKYLSGMNRKMRYYWKRNTQYIARQYGKFLDAYELPPLFRISHIDRSHI